MINNFFIHQLINLPMEYINKQICERCVDETNMYKFDCESCGLQQMTCRHNVYKCNKCDNFFCGKCSKKYQYLSNNILICNRCKQLK